MALAGIECLCVCVSLSLLFHFMDRCMSANNIRSANIYYCHHLIHVVVVVVCTHRSHIDELYPTIFIFAHLSPIYRYLPLCASITTKHGEVSNLGSHVIWSSAHKISMPYITSYCVCSDSILIALAFCYESRSRNVFKVRIRVCVCALQKHLMVLPLLH